MRKHHNDPFLNEQSISVCVLVAKCRIIIMMIFIIKATAHAGRQKSDKTEHAGEVVRCPLVMNAPPQSIFSIFL